MTIYKAIRRSIRSYFILYSLLGLCATIQVAACDYQFKLQAHYNHPLQNFPYQAHPTQAQTDENTDHIPATMPISTQPFYTHHPQPFEVHRCLPTPQHYDNYPFPCDTLNAPPFSAIAYSYHNYFPESQQPYVISPIGAQAFPYPAKTIPPPPTHYNGLYRPIRQLLTQPPTQYKIRPLQKNTIQSYQKKWLQTAKTGNSKLLAILYDNYEINIHTRGHKSNTALLWSAKNGNLDCIKYLISHGANIHDKNTWGNTALLLSAFQGHSKVVKYLVQQGANIHHKNKHGYTALLKSGTKGHIDCVNYLLQQGANIHDKNKWGNTALLLSAFQGHSKVVKYLVQQGADIHHKNKHGDTALLKSGTKGHVDCVNYLLQQGANIKDSDKDGNTALFLGIRYGHLACVKFLLRKGADIHDKNSNGNTALLLSAQNGHLDCIKFLLRQGADLHAKNKWGNTALLLSAHEGHLACVTYLHQEGVDINITNEQGNTAFLLSASKGHLPCVKYLFLQQYVKHILPQDANIIHDKNKWGSTALSLSAHNGYLDCVKYLVEHDADIHDKNKTGYTALLWSASKGHLSCIQYLVQQGAYTHHKNKQGHTALLLSAKNGHLDCLKYLVQQGANIYHKNEQGHTALLLSAKNGHLDCLNFFLTSVDVCSIDLQGINFSQSTLPKDLSATNLKDANLTGQHFTSTNFEGTQLEGAILTNTLCDYQQCFQDHINAKKLSGGEWYRNHLPQDLKSIAQVYPHLSQDSHKAELLQIASGLAYLPYWKDIEFYIKVYYWSCKLLLLKKQLDSALGKKLVCTLTTDLEDQAKEYCWQTDYIQHQAEEAKKYPHNDFDKYLKTFQEELQKYHCQSKEQWGYHLYKGNIEKNIQGLQKAYPKLTSPKHQQEAIDIAFQLSTLYQYEHWHLLFRYLSLQNRLIKLKIAAGVAAGHEIHYNKCP